MSRHALEFAHANRLRHVRLSDGDVVLPLGPRKRAVRVDRELGTQAWHAGGDTWRVFLQTQRPEAFATAFESLGAKVRRMDGEIEATIPEAQLLEVLDELGGIVRPWRKKTLSPEARAVARARFARVREETGQIVSDPA